LHPLSKSIQLGVIILALQFLRPLKIAGLPRIIATVAGFLGVSRKSGYQAARRIREILGAPPVTGLDEEVHRENIRLRIQNQVLAFERDHPGVRFTERHAHLPPEARSLCVRIFRDLKGQLKSAEIAAALGVPLPSLLRWCSETDDQAQFPPKPERRGTHRRTRPEDIQRVIEEFKLLTESVTLEEFTFVFNKKYPDHPLDRRTITRILQANGLLKTEIRNRPEPYHEHFKVYFPGAQVALDAHRCGVVFRSEPDKPYSWTKEVGIDIATGAILGAAVGKTEKSEGVERVLIEIQEEYQGILAVLWDNGSANRAADPAAILRWDEDGRIFSFPYHPQTNGHLEGLFGQFVRTVGRIEIDDSSKEALSFSVVEVIWRIFIHFHNHSPRKRLGGLSPLEYFRQYVPRPEEIQAAKKGLEEQRKRSTDSRRPHPRITDPVFRAQVEGILCRHRFVVAIEEAVKALLPFDREIIEGASSAFFALSQRQGFDERKRTFPYFMGIVRNKQVKLDASRRRAHHLDLQAARSLAGIEEARRAVEKERFQEVEELRTQPERVVLRYCELLLTGSLRFLRARGLEGLRRGLEALQARGRATRAVLEHIAGTIKSWGKFTEKLKEEMVKLLFEEGEQIRAGAT
jgi:transposase InsO family protein